MIYTILFTRKDGYYGNCEYLNKAFYAQAGEALH